MAARKPGDPIPKGAKTLSESGTQRGATKIDLANIVAKSTEPLISGALTQTMYGRAIYFQDVAVAAQPAGAKKR